MTGRLRTALQRRATAWAGMLTHLAREFAPAHLQGAISSKTQERGTDTYSIIITAKGADAAAQEYGSGLHDEQTPHLIEILPKKGEYLVFPWDRPDVDHSRLRHTPDGKVMLKHVWHPGIRPYRGIGYLRPAINELTAKGKAELSEDVRQAILGDLSESFRHGR